MPEQLNPTIATDELADLIRRWTSTGPSPLILAATNLLLEHEGWLWRADFRRTCIHYFPDEQMARFDWLAVQDLLAEEPRASTSELAILRFACALALDEFSWSAMGTSHQAMLRRAVDTALDS
ncbi:hypothetical protein [Prauserella endophytica]|uniref:Uncharacterized protein n=1 Tax=Prauserella endophytica TaxID=1592324 RepID=A0ABY2RUU3_9PSEU|nr:hypothetical protein [Prauserella endophytica]TKG61502.1 hypothetical protein FCN18_33215 [Prauserella endophytica]